MSTICAHVSPDGRKNIGHYGIECEPRHHDWEAAIAPGIMFLCTDILHARPTLIA